MCLVLGLRGRGGVGWNKSACSRVGTGGTEKQRASGSGVIIDIGRSFKCTNSSRWLLWQPQLGSIQRWSSDL